MCNAVWFKSVWEPPRGLVRHFQRQRIREARGLKGSLVSDGSFTKSEIRAMAENWVQVEDGPNIIDAEVYEGIELLENVFFFKNALIDDEDEPEDIMPINPNVPIP